MPDFWDVTAILGFLLLTTGIGLIHIPAAFIVAGSLLLIAAIRGSQGMST